MQFFSGVAQKKQSDPNRGMPFNKDVAKLREKKMEE